MLRAFERRPLDLRAISFAQNRRTSGKESEEQMGIFPKFYKQIGSLCTSTKEKPNKSKISFHAHIVPAGRLGTIGKSIVCLEITGFTKKLSNSSENTLRNSLLPARPLYPPLKGRPSRVARRRWRRPLARFQRRAALAGTHASYPRAGPVDEKLCATRPKFVGGRGQAAT